MKRAVKITHGVARGGSSSVLLLVLAVAVPTACVLWFMGEAVRNERLAVRQRLEEAYRGPLEEAKERLAEEWERKQIEHNTRVDPKEPAAEAFRRSVTDTTCYSVVVCDRSGRVRYPTVQPASASQPTAPSEAWQRAADRERSDAKRAARLYATIAELATDADMVARALQARVRCLVCTGPKADALAVVTGKLGERRLRNATDASGRFIVPNAQLLALRLIGDPNDETFQRVAAELVERLNDYYEPVLPSSQRRFLMHELRELLPEEPDFPTLEAEDLAAAYLASDPPPASPQLSPTPLPRVWHWASSDRTVVAVCPEGWFATEVTRLLRELRPVSGATIRVLPPGAAESQPTPFLVVAAPALLPGWQLGLYFDGPDPFAASAERRVALYVWIGVLVVVAIVVVAVLVAGYLRRQARLTRLKNDLVATVSH